MQSSLDAIAASKKPTSSVTTVTFDGLVIASNTNSKATALSSGDATIVSQMAMEALKLSATGGAITPCSERVNLNNNGGAASSSSALLLPYSNRQTVVSAANNNQTCLAADEKAIVDYSSAVGFKGIVVETDKRIIRCAPIVSPSCSSAAADATAAVSAEEGGEAEGAAAAALPPTNAAFLIVSELLA